MSIKVLSLVLNSFTNDSRVLKECKSLQKAGYDVAVVAIHDSGLEYEEVVEGVPVQRVKMVSRERLKPNSGKALKYLEFIIRASYAMYKKPIDIIHCNDLNALPVSVIVKLFSKRPIKIVYDCHEYQTEIKGLKGFKQTLARGLERWLIKYTDIILTVSNGIAEEYVRIYNVEKPRLVLNTPPYKQVQKTNIYRQKFNIDEETSIFLYQGGISAGRGIEVMLEAFKGLPDNLVIIFMGYGELMPLVQVAANQHENIFYHPAVSPDVLLDHTVAADFGICFTDNTCLNHYYCLPNKLFEFLMADLPVIVSNLPELRGVVEQFEVGLVAKNSDTEALKEAVRSIHKLDKQQTLLNVEKVKKVFNWEQQEKVLLEAYRDIE